MFSGETGDIGKEIGVKRPSCIGGPSREDRSSMLFIFDESLRRDANIACSSNIFLSYQETGKITNLLEPDSLFKRWKSEN